MYDNRENVRDIVNRVRTNSITHDKAVTLASKNRKQLATFYHDIISEVIDEMYAETMTETSITKRA